MMDNINVGDDIQGLFARVLGSEVEVKDNIGPEDESIFITFIKNLEKSSHIEDMVFDASDISISKITDPLWFIIENAFKLLYGQEATNLIFWYIYERYDVKGEIIAYEGDGKDYIFKTPQDLWSYIKFKYPPKEEI